MLNPEALPEELRDRDQWVCWKEEKRGDKLTKIPKQPDGSGANAKSNDNATWGSFDEALESATAREDWGVGFMFSSADPYVGIDLDNCIREDGMGPQDWLPSIEDVFANETFIERSPSGNGLHILLREARIPSWWTNQKDMETDREVAIHKEGRYFTVTGDTIDVSTDTVGEVEGLSEWLLEAYQAITGELPTDRRSSSTSATGRPERSVGRDLDLRDVISASEFEEGKRASHPFHSSSTGSNFAVQDWSAGLWNCYSGGCPGGKAGITGGNAAQLLGVKLGVWECGEWHQRNLTSEDWSEFYQEAREAGYDVGDPDYQGTSAPSIDPETQEAARSGNAEWDIIRSMYDQSDLPDRNARQAAAARLTGQYDFATPMDTEVLWIYDEETGVYTQAKNSTVKIEKILAENLGPHYSQHEKREILGKIKASSYITRDEFNGESTEHLLCVANGVLDLETRDLHEHDPSYLFTRGIPVEYDPDATAPGVEAFLEELVETGDEKSTLLEMLGAALWPTYLKGKFAIYFGEGANGKSTWFDVQEAFLGEENVSGWDLQNLSENRFTTSDLVGKFANVAPDMPASKIQQMGTLKTLTGGDTTMAERKGEPAFEFVNRATLMFGANRPPALPETSHAVARRLVPVRFPYQFTDEDDENPDARNKEALLEELTASDEQSGLLNLALDGLDRLRSSGDVSLSKSYEERLEYYEQFSDPIKEFRVRCLENETGHRAKKATVYEAFKNFCAENDYTVRDVRTFWRVLNQSTLTVDEARPLIDGQQERVLRGVRFTELGSRYAPAAMTLPEALRPAEGDEDTAGEEDVVDSSKEADVPFDASPIGQVAEEPTGYANLTVDVLVVEEPDGEQTPAMKATVEDASGVVDVVAWEAAGLLEEEKTYAILKAKVTEYQGQSQLEIRDGVTQVQEIQAGVGFSKGKPPAEGQPNLDAATDGGATADAGTRDEASAASEDSEPSSSSTSAEEPSAASEGDVPQADAVPMALQYVRTECRGRQMGVPHEEVLEELVENGVSSSTAEYAIRSLLSKGEIQEPAEDHYKAT